MTVNYFMLTKDGIDLDGKAYVPFAYGPDPHTTAVTDKVRKAPLGNLLANGSFESGLTGWNSYSTTTATSRTAGLAYLGSYSMRLATTPNGSGGYTAFGDTQNITVTPGQMYSVRCQVYAAIARTVTVNLKWYTSAGAFISAATTSKTAAAGAWTQAVVTATAPATATRAVVEVQAVNLVASTENVNLDDVWLEAVQDPTITGVPANLAGNDHLWARSSAEAQTTDGLPHAMPWPSTFFRSVFRVVRDPAVVADDSGDSLGTQIYNHGWVMAHSLFCYLYETRQGSASPAYSTLTWPPQESLAVAPVTGSPVVDDGEGYYGMESVTWPGPAVGVGTLRHLLSGDEGANRKVAAILDLLKATTSAQRTTIASTYTTNSTAIINALIHLGSVGGVTLDFDTQTPAQRQWSARYMLNGYLGRAAVGFDLSTLGTAAMYAMYAVTAKEVGLIGSTFTTADYETITDPIDAVLAMPSGY